MKLFWPRAVMEEVKPWAEDAYPYEGCGLLIGEFLPGGDKRVRRFEPLANLLQERDKLLFQDGGTSIFDVISPDLRGRVLNSTGSFEFFINPKEFEQKSLIAARENLDVVGVLHTHPDHPAVPSAMDTAQPLLAGYSVVIVKVDGKKFVEPKSWHRADEKDPFVEETIVLE